MDGRLIAVLAAFLLTACNEEQKEPPVVVFIGDSIIAHWDLAPLMKGAINVGGSGEITAQMLDRFDRDVLAYEPVIVVIEGGVNDLVSVIGPNPGHVAEMAARASSAGAQVVLLSVLPAEIPYDIGAWNTELKLIAETNGYEFVDFDPTMKDSLGQMKPELFQADGVHITDAGYAQMWQQLQPVVFKALIETRWN